VVAGGAPPAPVVPDVPGVLLVVPVVVVVVPEPGVVVFTFGLRDGISNMMPSRTSPTTISTPAIVLPLDRVVRVVVEEEEVVLRPEVVRRSSGRGDRSAILHLVLPLKMAVNGPIRIGFQATSKPARQDWLGSRGKNAPPLQSPRRPASSTAISTRS
jgi:hypothetical protein